MLALHITVPKVYCTRILHEYVNKQYMLFSLVFSLKPTVFVVLNVFPRMQVEYVVNNFHCIRMNACVSNCNIVRNSADLYKLQLL